MFAIISVQSFWNSCFDSALSISISFLLSFFVTLDCIYKSSCCSTYFSVSVTLFTFPHSIESTSTLSDESSCSDDDSLEDSLEISLSSKSESIETI